MKVWSFATTGPGNLKCKYVIHTVGGNHDGAGGSAEKVGEESMQHSTSIPFDYRYRNNIWTIELIILLDINNHKEISNQIL